MSGWAPPAHAVTSERKLTSVPWAYVQLITIGFVAAEDHCHKGPLDTSLSIFKKEHTDTLRHEHAILPIDHRFEHAQLCKKAYVRCNLLSKVMPGERNAATNINIYLAARLMCERLYNRIRASKHMRPYKFERLPEPPEIKCDYVQRLVDKTFAQFKNQSRRDIARFTEMYEAIKESDRDKHADELVTRFLLVMTLPLMFNIGLERAHTLRHIEEFVNSVFPDEGAGNEVD